MITGILVKRFIDSLSLERPFFSRKSWLEQGTCITCIYIYIYIRYKIICISLNDHNASMAKNQQIYTHISNKRTARCLRRPSTMLANAKDGMAT